MPKTTEVIISTDGTERYNSFIKELTRLLEEELGDYIALLEKACSNGIVSGRAHDELAFFKASVEEVRGQYTIIADRASRTNTEFLAQVDRDDQYLY